MKRIAIKSLAFRIFCTIVITSLTSVGWTQIVYDTITGAKFGFRTPGTNAELADRVRLTSVAHPTTRIRFYMNTGSNTQRTLRVAIYSADPVTGLPAEELVAVSQLFQAPGSNLIDVAIPSLQLADADIWVSFLFTPSGPGVHIGGEPSLGTSHPSIAYKEDGVWHYHWYSGATNNFAMQIFMTPK